MSEDDFESILNSEKKSSFGGQKELNSADIDELFNDKKSKPSKKINVEGKNFHQ